tara:strand:+ start:5689 stop:6717 length:1029 start_codon:yes stop_codon:yes gene_type:complete
MEQVTPEICGLGMLNKSRPQQLDDILKLFSDKGLNVHKLTFFKSKILKFLHILFYLPVRLRYYNVIHMQAHSYLNIVAVILALFWSKILNKKLIVYYCGGAAKSFFSEYPKLVKSVYSSVDLVVVSNKYIWNEFLKLDIKSEIIPHIMNSDLFKYKERNELKPRLLWVRHLRNEYNPMLLIEVFKKIKSIYPETQLKIIGDGYLREKIINTIKEENINGIEVMGYIDRDCLMEYFNWADIFLNTTNIDNQPVSVLEAMKCGLPVVSTDVGGIPELITHRENGLLSPENDADKMAKNIDLLLRESKLGSDLSRAGNEFVENTCSSKIIFAKWSIVYQKLGFKL